MLAGARPALRRFLEEELVVRQLLSAFIHSIIVVFRISCQLANANRCVVTSHVNSFSSDTDKDICFHGTQHISKA